MASVIVVGTDGSKSALNAVDEAGRLASTDGCVVHVVSAFRSPAAAAAVPGAVSTADMRPAADEALQAACERLKNHGVQVETHAIAGSAAEALIGVAETHEAQLIVVGSVGMRGARRVLGSVPNTVTHRAPCNVLVVRTG